MNCCGVPLFAAEQEKPLPQPDLDNLMTGYPQSYPQVLWISRDKPAPGLPCRWKIPPAWQARGGPGKGTVRPGCRRAGGTCPKHEGQAKVAGLKRPFGGSVFAIIQAAGWPIWPLLFASIIALALIIERLVALRRSKVAPEGLLARVVGEVRQGTVNEAAINALEQGSPLGRVLAAGLRNVKSSREVMKESIEEAGRGVTHELERYLTTLGTIASISPLMGLFGTVVGMIEIFGSQAPTGANPMQLAHGISIALYNTGFGLVIAIPAMIFWRHFRALVDSFVIEMEQQAVKLVEVVHGERN